MNSLTIRLPDAKVCGAWGILHDPVFKEGNRIIPVKNAQVLRGLINHWTGANRFWKYTTAPINATMGRSDETNTWVRCGNDQILIAVWNLMKFLRGCANDEVIWGKLFGGSLVDLIPLPKRLSSPEPDVQILWVAGDAVLGRFSAINWTNKVYVVEDAMEFLEEINPDHRQLVICDSEQLDAASIITLRGEEKCILLMGTDNTNVMAWTSKGHAKKGGVAHLKSGNREVGGKEEYSGRRFYLRSGHNFSDDWLSRPDLDKIMEWGNRMGFFRARFRARWNEFVSDWIHNQVENWAPVPALLEQKTSSFSWLVCGAE